MKREKGKRKKNAYLYVDGENISYKKGEKIMRAVERRGNLDGGKVYGLQKDGHTRGWSEKSKEYGLKDIRLFGSPEKDKVDKKIKKDAQKEISQHKNIDIIYLATSDAGYVDCIIALRAQGKRVVVIGEGKASYKLRTACSEFIEV